MITKSVIVQEFYSIPCFSDLDNDEKSKNQIFTTSTALDNLINEFALSISKQKQRNASQIIIDRITTFYKKGKSQLRYQGFNVDVIDLFLVNRVQEYLKMEYYLCARIILKIILQHRPTYYPAVQLYAKSLINQKAYQPAARFLAAHLKVKNGAKDVWLAGAFCVAYSHVHRQERKKIVAVKRIEITGDLIDKTTSLKKLCGIGRVLSYQKKYELAYKTYAEAYQIDPHCKKAKKHLKRVLNLLQSNDKVNI